MDFCANQEQIVRGCQNPDRNRQETVGAVCWPKAQQALAGLLGAVERLGGRADLAFMPGAVRHVQSREA